MYIRDPIVRVNVASGNSMDVLDPSIVQTNFNEVRDNFNMDETRLKELDARMSRLEKFLTFCRDNWPDVIRDFAVVEAAKVRVGAQKPESLVEEIERLVRDANRGTL